MRLYQIRFLCIWLFLLLAACEAPQVTQAAIQVRISADGKTANVQIPTGSTVQDLLQVAEITVDPLDRTDPPVYTLLTEGADVRVIRVSEEFTVEEVVIPFDKQVIRNEALPDGETRLIQPGVNGKQEITYRRVYEDGVEVSVNPVKSVVIEEAAPEIVMVGSQSPFAPVTIPGKLTYLSSGNAWVMEENTGNRRPVVTTGDLDGRVFKLSQDGAWLLFTRNSEEEDTINTLWAAKIDDDEGLMIDLGVENVVHFADWVPNASLRVVFSTVEPREAPPGWQANNDLQMATFSVNGWVSRRTVSLDTNSGGIYGWWGTTFEWAPDGLRMGFARPDGVGILDLEEEIEAIQPLLDITPLQTQSDWAWVPGLSWAPTGNTLFTVNHGSSDEVTSPEESPIFDLMAVPLEGGGKIPLVSQSGMFAYPVPSPMEEKPSGEQAYRLAFLQSIFPTQSKTSRYRLVVMDRDGSNRRVLFPEEGAPGLDPQQVFWSPAPFGDQQSYWIALIYQGNLFLVDSTSGEARQLTGDGLIDRLDWS